METKVIVKETWLSRKPRKHALDFSLLWLAFLLLGSFAYLNGLAGAEEWMPATCDLVFGQREFWRAWTTLFAHANLGHVLSNALVFLPFSFFLAGYFGPWFFPGLGLLLGGIVNLAVLSTMPGPVILIGFSGVVYWMGASWMTLYLLIERREPKSRRLGKVILLTTVLFIPETFKPEVSYLSHFLGFAFGVLSGLAYYRVERTKILAAEKKESLLIEDGIEEDEWLNS